MKVKDITNSLEEWAPLAYQESYDNCGLLVGNPDSAVDNILITLDITEAVIEEAISKKCDMIISHHPLIFKGLKKISGKHWVERCVSMAIKNDIALYAIHTNLDNVDTGVNRKICEKIGLTNPQILQRKDGMLSKLVSFIPADDIEKVMAAIYAAGGGEVGNYDHCSFQIEGTGTFRPGEGSEPHIGKVNQDETVHERRVEVIFPSHLSGKVIGALQSAHPYEEVAYYLNTLANKNPQIGSGMIGMLPEPMESNAFLQHLKVAMNLQIVRHTGAVDEKINKVAVCGGSGSFLLKRAIDAGAHAFVSGDFKYHDFFEADNKVMIADIGHFESEVFTKDLIHDFLRKKFANIALLLSVVNTNPINYT